VRAQHPLLVNSCGRAQAQRIAEVPRIEHYLTGTNTCQKEQTMPAAYRVSTDLTLFMPFLISPATRPALPQSWWAVREWCWGSQVPFAPQLRCKAQAGACQTMNLRLGQQGCLGKEGFWHSS